MSALDDYIVSKGWAGGGNAESHKQHGSALDQYIADKGWNTGTASPQTTSNAQPVAPATVPQSGEAQTIAQNSYLKEAQKNKQDNAAIKTRPVQTPQPVSQPAGTEIDKDGFSGVSGKIPENGETKKVNWLDTIYGTIAQGAGQFDKAVTSTADMLFGGFLQEIQGLLGVTAQGLGLDEIGSFLIEKDNPVTALNKWVDQTNQQVTEHYAKQAEGNKAAEAVNKYGTMVSAAVPMAALAFLTAGQSAAAATTTAGLQATAAAAESTGLGWLSTVSANTIKTLAADPNAQLAFVQATGPSYESALEEGASDSEALLYALVNGSFNALVEVGGADDALGGIQGLPENIQRALVNGDDKLVLQWVKSVVGEVGEEVVQGMLERGLKEIYGADTVVYSTDPEQNAIISPADMAEEAKGAAIVSAILGGTQTATQAAIDAGHRRNQQTTQNSTQEVNAETSGTQNTQTGAVDISAEAHVSNKVFDMLSSGDVSNSKATQIINDPQMLAAFEDLTGLKVEGTKSQQRAIIRQGAEAIKSGLEGQGGISAPPSTANANTAQSGRLNSGLETETDADGAARSESEPHISSDTANVAPLSPQVEVTDGQRNTAPIEAVGDTGTILNTADNTPQVAPGAPQHANISENNINNSSENAKGNHNVLNDASRQTEAIEAPYDRAANAEEMAEQVTQGANDSMYDALGEVYGTIPAGEKAERASNTPQRISGDQPVSRTARTVLEAKATPEARLETVRDAIVDGKLSYIPVQNQSLASEAISAIERNGWQESLTRWTADVRSGKSSPKLTAMGAVMLNNAGNSDMSGRQYAELMADYSMLLSGAGQTVQAARILKTLTPEARLYGIQRTVDSLNEQLTSGQKKAIEKAGGRRNVSNSDNVPVFAWADKAGERLAKEIGKQTALSPEVAKTVSQTAEADIKKIIAKHRDTQGKSKRRRRSEHDTLVDLLSNANFYNEIYESMRATLEVSTKMNPEALKNAVGEWVSYSLPDLLANEAAGRGDIKLDEALVQKFLDQTTDEGRDAVISEMQQDIADQIPATFMEKVDALRYVNMLGNFKTQIRNVGGNVAMGLGRAAKDRIAAGLEMVAYAASGGKLERTKSMWAGKELYSEAWADFKAVQDVALGESKYTSARQQISSEIQDKRTIFKQNKLEKAIGQGIEGAVKNATGKDIKLDKGLMESYRKATNWAIEQGDVIFSRMNYADALAGWMKAHGIKSIADATESQMERGRQFAIKEAQEATFRDTNAVSEWASGFDKNWGKRKDGRTNAFGKFAQTMTQGIVPFRKTPANVAVRALEYSPLGILDTGYKAFQLVQGKGDVSGADVINSLSKTMTGSGIAALGYLMALAGKARAKEDDDKEAAFLKQQGIQDYSVTLPNGKSVTVDWVAPYSIPFFVGVELAALTDDGDLSGDDWANVLGALVDPMLEMSMLSGLNDAIDNISSYNGDIDALPQFIMNSIGSYFSQIGTNSLLGQLERASGENRQTTYTDKESSLDTGLQYILGKAAAKTPGVDYHQQDYIDAWGRKQSNGSVGERIFNSLFNPAYVSQDRSTPVDGELLRIYDANKDKDGFPNVLPQKPSRSLDVGGAKMTAEEYEQYCIDRGSRSLDLVSDFVESPEYKTLSDEQRATVISDLYQFAADRAKKAVQEGRGNEYASSWDYAEGMDVPEYLSVKTAYNDAKNAGDYDAIDDILSMWKDYNLSTQRAMEEKFSKIGTLLEVAQGGVNAGTYEKAKTGADALGNANGRISQEELYAYLSSSDLSQKEKDTIWDAQGWKSGYDEYGSGNAWKKSSLNTGNSSSNSETDELMRILGLG